MKPKLVIDSPASSIWPSLLSLAGLASACSLIVLSGCKPGLSEASQPELATDRLQISPAAAYSQDIRPIDVCEHLARMVASEAGMTSAQFDPVMLQDCERDLTMEASLRGSENWNALAACVIRAQNEAQLQACDEQTPLPDDASAPPLDDQSQEYEACENMVEVIINENQDDSDAAALAPNERRELIGGCVVSLMSEQRPTLELEAYTGLLSCLIAARSTADIQAC